MAMQLIRTEPSHFPNIGKADAHKTGAFASEDVNRVICALRCAWRTHTLKKGNKTTRRFANTLPAAPYFLTNDDIRRFQTQKDVSLPTVVVKDSTEPALAESFTNMRDQLLGRQEAAAQQGLDWFESGDVRNVEKSDEEATKDMSTDPREAYLRQK
jgi:hypothetical protein